MKKIKVHRDYHHIHNKKDGGNNSTANLLFIKVRRHRALHKMFGNQTLRMIFITIKEVNFRIIMSDADNLENWNNIFEGKCKAEALALLQRVIRAKESQRR